MSKQDITKLTKTELLSLVRSQDYALTLQEQYLESVTKTFSKSMAKNATSSIEAIGLVGDFVKEYGKRLKALQKENITLWTIILMQVLVYILIIFVL